MSVTPPKPHDELIAVASRLSRAAPNTWAEFTRAFEAYTGSIKDSCVHAPSDKILQAQGRALQCEDIAKHLAEAIKQK